MPDYDVIIAGGGPVGMGLAIDLGQRGHRVAVVERYPEPQPIPKGQNLTQRTMEHMAAWGCEAALRGARVMDAGVPNKGLVAYGTILSDYSYDWMPRESVQPYYFKRVERLPQYATERVLRARAAAVPGVDLLYGWTVETVSQTGENASVRITERGGAPATPRDLTAHYVVGCDGSRSTIRQAAGMTETSADHDKRMVLLVFRSTELHALLAERYETRAFYNALRPDLEGYWLFLGRVDVGSEWFFHAPVPPDTTRDNFDFEAFLREAVGANFPIEMKHIGFWELRIALADRYRVGRVLIAGDAAHSHPPYGGYGINTGFEDARNLAWKLSAVLSGWGGPALLDSYDAERRPVFRSLADDFIGKFIEDDRDFLRSYSPDTDLRAFQAAWIARNAGASEVFAFEPNYEGSPIICGPTGSPSSRGSHAFEARPGHHLAPQTLAEGQDPWDALGEGFTLLVLDGQLTAAEAMRKAAQSMSLPLRTVISEAPNARDAFAASLVLVRPDTFVAWAGDRLDRDPEAILSQVAGR